ncbi:MAG: hypothetical protein AB1499_04860 [Nitrospirota bacterium]
MIAVTVAVNAAPVRGGSQVRISEGEEWRYFKGTTNPPDKWKQIDFDDRNWLRGPTGLGYGGSNGTYLDDMRGKYSTVYSRRVFHVNDIYSVTGMTLTIECDGAFIAYLNSVEIIRNDAVVKSAPDNPTHAELLDISGFVHELLPGNNVLSVECSNDDINSKDFSFVTVFEILEYQKDLR